MNFRFVFEALLLLLTLYLSGVNLQDGAAVPVEVITDSSPCSATCGLGIKSQTLCLLKDSKAAMEENRRDTRGPEVTGKCHVRKVRCMDSWQCGLKTVTVLVGQRLDIDCLEEVMKEMGRYSWRVSWRYARGVITSDDSLFAQWEAPELDHVVLDPVQEKQAGTYRCDVQDARFRRVKRIYWGVRVLPPGVINLDQDSTAKNWPKDRPQGKNMTHTDEVMLIAIPILSVGAPVLAFTFLIRKRIKQQCLKLCSTIHGQTAAIPPSDGRGQCETSERTAVGDYI